MSGGGGVSVFTSCGAGVVGRSLRVFGLVERRRSERASKVRLVTSRGCIDRRILATLNSVYAGGCTRNCPKTECCNKYRIISRVRRLTVSHLYRLCRTRCTGIRPRSKTRTGVTIVVTYLEPKRAFVKLSLTRKNRLARNSPIGVSKVLCGTITCNLGRTGKVVSCRRVRRETLRFEPGLVVKNTSTCSHR